MRHQVLKLRACTIVVVCAGVLGIKHTRDDREHFHEHTGEGELVCLGLLALLPLLLAHMSIEPVVRSLVECSGGYRSADVIESQPLRPHHKPPAAAEAKMEMRVRGVAED